MIKIIYFFLLSFYSIYCIPILLNNEPNPFIITLGNNLEDYYESITDQIVISLNKDIMSSASSMYLINYDQESNSFSHSLHHHLNLMRYHLLASIRPLIDSNIPWIFIKKEEEGIDTKNEYSWTQSMTKKILLLNQRISQQLGMIINVDETSFMMIYQSLPTKHQQQEMKSYNELNDIMEDIDWMDQNEEEDLILTNELKNHQFIFNKKATTIMDQGKEKDTIPHEQLVEWLRHCLLNIESIVLDEFNNRLEDLIQIIMEDVLYD
ncbi:unnamed protein product [Cunninghamella echinulata]